MTISHWRRQKHDFEEEKTEKEEKLPGLLRKKKEGKRGRPRSRHMREEKDEEKLWSVIRDGRCDIAGTG